MRMVKSWCASDPARIACAETLESQDADQAGKLCSELVSSSELWSLLEATGPSLRTVRMTGLHLLWTYQLVSEAASFGLVSSLI